MNQLAIPELAVFLGGSGPAQIPLSMLIVFVSAKLMAELFERINQPGIVGEILAGIVIGPSVLGLIAPSEFLTALSDLGAMFLLFRVGLEVRSSELMKVGGTATLVACCGVVVPFLMGWGILILWGSPSNEAIFVGASMVATSVGITAQVLSAKGLLHAVSSKIILAAAVIDDVLGLLVLAVVSSLTHGKLNILALSLTAALAVGFTVIVAKWGTHAMGRVVPHVDQKLRVGEAQFALAMSLLFALSLAAVYIGVAAIVGAFLAGLALAESTGARVRDLAHGVTELLVPFFLAGIGLHVSLAAFSSPQQRPAGDRDSCGSRGVQIHRMRPGCNGARQGGCSAHRCGYDPTGRSRDGRSTNRARVRNHLSKRLRRSCFHVCGNHDRGAAANQGDVPQLAKHQAG